MVLYVRGVHQRKKSLPLFLSFFSPETKISGVVGLGTALFGQQAIQNGLISNIGIITLRL
jgi:hypothetical protein